MSIVLYLATVYAAVGIVFAIVFVIAGIGVVDPVARSSSTGFRLVVMPGCAALWPLLLRRWMRAR